MRRRHTLAAIGAAMALPAWAAPLDGLTAALQSDIDRYLAARGKREHISAVSVSVSLAGTPAPMNVVAGTTTYGGKAAVTPANLFQIGSQTKAFTGVVGLQLQAEGKLKLDQPLGAFLPRYKAWSDVTIRSLLNMTSPIPEYADNKHFLAAVAADPGRAWTVPELIAFAEPGVPGAPKPSPNPWHYSNTNYLLAELVIEKVTGNPLQTEIENRLLGPRYGLTDTFYIAGRYPAAVTDRMVSGYFFNRSPGNEPLAPLLGRDMKDIGAAMFQGAGGMVSRPEDMTRWVRALYQGDVLAPPQRAELMQLVSVRTGRPIARPTRTDPTAFGLGVGAFIWPLAGEAWYYLGETLGYRMFYGWFTKPDVVLAIGLNSQPDRRDERSLHDLIETLTLTLRRAGKL